MATTVSYYTVYEDDAWRVCATDGNGVTEVLESMLDKTSADALVQEHNTAGWIPEQILQLCRS
jgi:hypothetical protein|eukprot:COSAG01_NODE_19538_length_1004_cov_1.820994_1_plen_63_part_00